MRTSGGLGFVMAGEVTLSVTGATFGSKTPEHAHGDGRFEGPAWAWDVTWTETRHHDSWTEDIEGWLDDGHLRFSGRIVEKATTWSAELDVLDCVEYEPRIEFVGNPRRGCRALRWLAGFNVAARADATFNLRQRFPPESREGRHQRIHRGPRRAGSLALARFRASMSAGARGASPSSS